MSREFTWNEIKLHNKPEDLHLVIRGNIYDVTKIQIEHPGGAEFLLDQGGTDVTELFDTTGHGEKAMYLLGRLKVGVVEAKMNNSDTTDSDTSSQQRIAPNPNLSLRSFVALPFLLGVLAVVSLQKWQEK